ncbi:MAG: dihydrodipicolinate synthase family protein [Rhodospirillales bacterium]|nr:dihydrodipicolinate synthase family protein [Rhodospirillales bacterium]
MTKTTPPGPAPISGLWTAVMTPLDEKLGCDHARLAAHCKDLMARGVDGVAPFGTTGEGTSFTAQERIQGTDALIAAGVPASKIVLGNGSAALGDAIAMAKHSVKVGLAGVLTLPPFFFKNLDDEGVYASFAEIVEQTGDERLRLYLYNIPQISGVQIGFGAIERLLARYPGVVAGIKDSSADWPYTAELLKRFPEMCILVGAEAHVPKATTLGGRGTICGMANLVPEAMRFAIDRAGTPEGDSMIQAIATVTDKVLSVPFVPALKAVKASDTGDQGWNRVRAPLRVLPQGKAAEIVSAVAGFRAARPLTAKTAA